MRTVTVTWEPDAERFAAAGTQPGFVITVNAPHLDHGAPPTGFSPTELLLAGAGACAGWDVIDIMRRRRHPISGLEVRVDGLQGDKPPHAYEELRLHFRVTGDSVDEAEVRRVLQLSLERYCSVLATVRSETRIEETLEIVSPEQARP
jgi:putative redox protein